MNIDDDLGQIDETFMMMDHQLAFMSQDDVIEDISGNVIMLGDVTSEPAEQHVSSMEVDSHFGDLNLDELDAGLDLNGGMNPFDDWEKDTASNFDELVKKMSEEVVPPSVAEDLKVKVEEADVNNNVTVKKEEEEEEEVVVGEEEEEGILNDPDLFPSDSDLPSTAALDDFDEDLFDGAGKMSLACSMSDVLLKEDLMLPQVPFEAASANSSEPHVPVISIPEDSGNLDRDFFPINNSSSAGPSHTSHLSRGVSVESDFLEQVNVDNGDIDQADEDIIMQVLKESAIDLEEEIEIKEEVKQEIKEEPEELDVTGNDYELSLAQAEGATAEPLLSFESLHQNVKAAFKVIHLSKYR